MTRSLGLFVLLAFAPAVRADSQLLFNGIPSEYTPGTPFTFDLEFGAMPPNSLLSYSFVMNVTASDPSQLLVSVSKPSDLSTFVFQSNPSTLMGVGPSSQIDVSGQVLGVNNHPPQPVSITAGQNEVLAVFTVTPSANLTGPITFSIDGSQSTFASSGENFSTSPPQDQTSKQAGGSPTSSVPTPAGWMLMGVGMAVMAVRRTRTA